MLTRGSQVGGDLWVVFMTAQGLSHAEDCKCTHPGLLRESQTDGCSVHPQAVRQHSVMQLQLDLNPLNAADE